MIRPGEVVVVTMPHRRGDVQRGTTQTTKMDPRRVDPEPDTTLTTTATATHHPRDDGLMDTTLMATRRHHADVQPPTMETARPHAAMRAPQMTADVNGSRRPQRTRKQNLWAGCVPARS
jgi:hypothetical protein